MLGINVVGGRLRLPAIPQRPAFWLACGLGLWAVTPGQAQSPVVSPETPFLSLAEARRVALARNWDLLAARTGLEAAEAQKLVARELPNPQLSLSTSQINLNGRSNATASGNAIWRRSYDTVVAVSQLIEIGGKRAQRRASAQAAYAGAEARFQEARRALHNGLTQAYVLATLAGEKAEVLHESARSLRREASIAEARLRVGEISASELRQIEIAAERLETDALGADNEAVTARIAVDVLLGTNPATGNWLPREKTSELASEPAPESAAGVGDRPDLVAARADVTKAEADLALQRAQRVPDPTLSVQYEHQPPDFPETVGLGVSIPLPLWSQNKGQIRGALAAREQAVQQLHKLEAQASAEVATARRNYASAAARLQRQRELVGPKSAEVVRSVAAAYAKGGASLLELLAAERGDAEIRLATVQAAADTAIALASLRAALNLNGSSNAAP